MKPRRRSGPRLLLYSHDGQSLGHLRRNLNIAGAVLERRPAAAVLLLAGVPGVPGVQLPAGADLVKLPSIRKVDTDRWQPASLGVDARRLNALRRDLIAATVRTYRPDLLLVDYLPAGMGGELAVIIDELAARGRTRLVLGLRDILRDPEVTLRSWRHNAVRGVLGKYQRVLVYGDRSVIDTAAVYGLEDLFDCPVEHTGYVGPAGPWPERAGARRDVGLDDGWTLALATAGGGAHAYPLLRLALAGFAVLPVGHRMRMHLLAGPLMDQVDYERLAANLVPGVRLERITDRLPTLMVAADVVLTGAAYNTLVESIGLGRPVLSMPRPGPSAEQTLRAGLFERLGLLRTIPADCSPAGLAELLLNVGSSPTPQVQPQLDGRARVASTLLEMLDDRRDDRAAAAVA